MLKLQSTIAPRLLQRLRRSLGLDDNPKLSVGSEIVPVALVIDASETEPWPIFPTYSVVIVHPVAAAGERGRLRLRNPHNHHTMIRPLLVTPSVTASLLELVKTDSDLANIVGFGPDGSALAGLFGRMQALDGRRGDEQSVARWSYESSTVQSADGTFGTIFSSGTRPAISFDWNWSIIVPPGYALDILDFTAAAAATTSLIWNEVKRDGAAGEDAAL